MVRYTLFSLSLLLFLPDSSLAAPAITCHCFTERKYDFSRPAVADPYFLTTTQNSFFATYFAVDKKVIVMKKQTGSSADDLWIGYWIASKSGLSADDLLELRGKKGSWKEVVAPLGLPSQSVGERFSAEVMSGATADRLAQIIVDEVLLRHRLLGLQELTVLRKEWATNQEVIISAMLAPKSKRPAVQLFREVKRGAKSWGVLLGDAKIQPAGMSGEFAALLK